MTGRWAIYPFIGLGELRLGMSRNQTRELLDQTGRITLRQNEFAVTDTDAYPTVGVHLHFDTNDNLEIIEAMEPCSPSFQEACLLRESLPSALNLLHVATSEVREKTGSYLIDSLGLGLYAPDDLVEVVTVARQGVL